MAIRERLEMPHLILRASLFDLFSQYAKNMQVSTDCRGLISVWDEYPFFGRMNIRIYSLPQILDKWISKYIRHYKKITNEYPSKFAIEKINEYFCELIYLSKIFKYILISDKFPDILLDYFGNFHILCYFLPQINLFWTNNNYF